MRANELTQKFRLKGEICPKSDTSNRWRILDAYDTYCYIKEVGGDDYMTIDYDVLDRDWTPYKRTSKKVFPTFVMDNFDNEVRVGDASPRRWWISTTVTISTPRRWARLAFQLGIAPSTSVFDNKQGKEQENARRLDRVRVWNRIHDSHAVCVLHIEHT